MLGLKYYKDQGGEGVAHLQLLHGRHVVAQHAILQHGDGVALTAHFLDLLASAVAAGSHIKHRLINAASFVSSLHVIQSIPSLGLKTVDETGGGLSHLREKKQKDNKKVS